MRRVLTLTALALCTGCTFDDGRGYATLESASLSVTFEPGPARDLGNDTVLTNLGYAVRVTELTLDLGGLELAELVTSARGGQSFDPTNPPEGYGLCHGGHCHADDGRLVSYADIEAELAGGGEAAFQPVVTLATGGPVEALADPRLESLDVAPSRELPRVTLRKASLPIRTIILKATARRAEDDGSSAIVHGALEAGPTLERGLDFTIDRDGPERLKLTAALVIDGALFDDIDFEPALGVGATTWSVDDPDAQRFTQNLATPNLGVTLE